MNVRFALLVAAGCCVLAFTKETTMADELPLEKREFQGAGEARLLYRLLKPAEYKAETKYPLVVFLHGAGERGNDNTAQLKHGVAEFCTPERRRAYPCFLIAPQCPEGKKWVEVDWSAAAHRAPEEPSDALGLTFSLIESLQKEFSLDANRIYVTGLSMGGYGTWDAAARHPERFAAAVPICGGGDEKSAPRLVNLPLWAFHGAKDEAVKVERSRNMIEAIRQAGGHPNYTEYAEEGHASWVPAYRDEELYKWLFAQRRTP